MVAGRPSATKAGPTLSDLAERTDTVRVNFELDRIEHTKLKIHAARTGRSVSDILREMVASIDDMS
ncbi:chromosome partitioning protein ParB [Haematospirillum sp. 15-248]|nr:chromosome partitioning protein ParB [Haematospirillum sp. 15-248]